MSVWHAVGVGCVSGKGTSQAWPRATRSLGSHIWALAWSPALPILAVGGSDGTVRLLTGRDLGQHALLTAPFRSTPVLKAPDTGLAAAAEGGSRTAAGARGRGPRLAAGAATNALQWSPGGKALAITATGVPLRLWQPSRGIAATYDENWDMNAVAWRPGGSALALAADDGSLTLLRVAPPDALAQASCLLGLGRAEWRSLLGRGAGTPASSPPSYMSR